jgi:xanthine dehydrogenase accessory factor
MLYVFGAGHVAINLCQSAASAGFDVVVTDDRSSYATKERFPTAREVHALDFDQATQQLDPNESSYIVIVTRGHRDDMRILHWAVQTRARYIGMIGSRRKVIEIFKTLQNEGVPAHLFDRVHAPVGLDIGAITPEEIAVAITAELIAVRRHATAALPHLSWFKATRIESNVMTESGTDSASAEMTQQLADDSE